MTTRVRLASEADLDALTELKVEWSQLPARPSDGAVRALKTELSAWLTERENVFGAVAFVDSDLVGMAWLVLVPRAPNVDDLHRWSGDLQSVYVKTAHRDKGLGHELVSVLVGEAKAKGVRELTVSANDAARTFYQDLGFTTSSVFFVRRLD